jgi:hypothetical protein
MIHIALDLQRLSQEQRDEWQQLTANVDTLVSENIEAWEKWKQLKNYEELFQKTPRTVAVQTKLHRLQTVLHAYLQPDGEISVAHRSSRPEFSFRQPVWAAIKTFLMTNIFHGKCAYCETQTGQFYYDAEHYRPKGMVTVLADDGESQQRITAEDESGRAIDHPGYFWLAYEWKNLVPSCKSCNGPGGKMTQFPVQQFHVFLKRLTLEEATAMVPPPYQSPTWPGMYYLRTEQLDALEEPLLLHPYLDNENDPRRHIRFGYKGIEYAVNNSPKGLHSIKVFRLGKDTLREERYKIQKRAVTQLTGAYAHFLQFENLSPEEAWRRAREAICEFEQGTTAYCAAALDYVDESLKIFGEANIGGQN